MKRPPIEATLLRQLWPLMVIVTSGRVPAPSASTTSAGTSTPVAFPAGTTVAVKVRLLMLLSLHDEYHVSRRVEHVDGVLRGR
jgi:hypothetical protein